jgi:FkbM family methyltransferase
LTVEFPITSDAHSDPDFATVGAASMQISGSAALRGIELGFSQDGALAFALPVPLRAVSHMVSAFRFAPGRQAGLTLVLHLQAFSGEAVIRIGRVFAGHDYDPYRFNPYFERIAHEQGRPIFAGEEEVKAEFIRAARTASMTSRFNGMQSFIRPFIVQRMGEPHFPMLVGTPNSISWYAIDPPHGIEAYRRDGIIRPGERVLDCGAHAGQMAALFGLVGGTDVIAIDPFPQNTLQIEAQARLNNLPGLKALRAGVGEARARLRFSILGQETSGSGTQADDLIDVDIVPLDDFLSMRPNMIKLDVEGAEVSALRGAQRLLRECRPRLFCELHTQMIGNFGHTPADFFAAIPADIYDIKYMVEGVDHAWRRWEPSEASRITAPSLVLAEAYGK